GGVGHAGAETTHGEGRADHDGQAHLGDGRVDLLHRVADRAAGGLASDALDDVLEHLPVLAAVDGGDVRTDELDPVLVEDAPGVEVHRRVECGLAPEGGEDRIHRMPGRGFLGEDLVDVLGRDRLDVCAVGELRIGHDRGGVGVDQRHPQPLRAQHATRLGAGIVELAGLAADDRAGADHEDVVDVCAARHQCVPFLESVAAGSAPSRLTKRSKRSAASRGPAAASGWYWTENAEPSVSATPSTVPSLAHTWVTVAGPHGVSQCSGSGARRAHPWFWEVIANAPVALSTTGVLGPRCPNRILSLSSPSARPRIWLPKQIPKNGIPCPSTSLVRCTASSAAAGSPGPLERNTPSTSSSRTSWSVDPAGITWTLTPRAASMRGVFVLMPRSSAATE